MLHECPHPMHVGSFVQDYLGKQPYATPGSAANAMAVFGWDTLEWLLIDHPEAYILVIAKHGMGCQACLLVIWSTSTKFLRGRT